MIPSILQIADTDKRIRPNGWLWVRVQWSCECSWARWEWEGVVSVHNTFATCFRAPAGSFYLSGTVNV